MADLAECVVSICKPPTAPARHLLATWGSDFCPSTGDSGACVLV